MENALESVNRGMPDQEVVMLTTHIALLAENTAVPARELMRVAASPPCAPRTDYRGSRALRSKQRPETTG